MKKSEIRKKDKVWAKNIRDVAAGKCESCCTFSQYINAHHLISNRFHVYRWLPLNGVALCPRCHRFGLHAVHNNPIYVIEQLRKNKGEEWYQTVLKMMEEIK